PARPAPARTPPRARPPGAAAGGALPRPPLARRGRGGGSLHRRTAPPGHRLPGTAHMTTAPATIRRITGTLVEAGPLPSAGLYELALVGEHRLLGEVIRVQGPIATLQVYEDTNGLAAGEPVISSGRPLEIELGPGLLGAILDGLGRPLPELARNLGDFLVAGGETTTLDQERRWHFEPGVVPGQVV